MIFRANRNRYTNSQRNERKDRWSARNEVSVVPLIISMVAPGETNRAKRWTGNTANSMKIDSRRYRSLAPRRWQMSVFHESTFFDHRATDLFVTMFSNSPSATPSRILSTRRHRPASTMSRRNVARSTRGKWSLLRVVFLYSILKQLFANSWPEEFFKGVASFGEKLVSGFRIQIVNF